MSGHNSLFELGDIGPNIYVDLHPPGVRSVYIYIAPKILSQSAWSLKGISLVNIPKYLLWYIEA